MVGGEGGGYGGRVSQADQWLSFPDCSYFIPPPSVLFGSRAAESDAASRALAPFQTRNQAGRQQRAGARWLLEARAESLLWVLSSLVSALSVQLVTMSYSLKGL